MEMSALQLVMRLFSSLGQIEQGRLRTGNLDDLDWPKLTSAMTLLKKSNIFIDETPALSPADLRARARRLRREHDIGLIVIDYLQLMAVPDSRENRANEIAEISRSLKALAKELNVPVIALSQLNRSLEQRPNKRPVMADLRESGSIEQDADLILFIYRDEVYDKESAAKGTAEIIIGKHRNGETGTVKLVFQGPWLRFVNMAPDYFHNERPRLSLPESRCRQPGSSTTIGFSHESQHDRHASTSLPFAITWKCIRGLAPGAGLVSVVKADAYGHGMAVVTPALGASELLAVATVDELESGACRRLAGASAASGRLFRAG